MQGRRQILKAGLAGAAVAVPAVASAQQTFNWKMTSAYGKGAPFYMEGPARPPTWPSASARCRAGG